MREFSDEELRWQASKLAHYVKHGGSAKVWLDSKDFTAEDRRVIRRFWYANPNETHDVRLYA